MYFPSERDRDREIESERERMRERARERERGAQPDRNVSLWRYTYLAKISFLISYFLVIFVCPIFCKISSSVSLPGKIEFLQTELHRYGIVPTFAIKGTELRVFVRVSGP